MFYTLIVSVFFHLFDLKPRVVYIQPLGNVEMAYIQAIKTEITNFYGFACIVKERENITNNLLTNSKKNYDASKILTKYTTKDIVLVITEKGLACQKENMSEWDVIGLSRPPASICVISTDKLKKNVNSKSTIIERAKKVSLHEIGHLLGLNHCNKSSKCMMNEGKGLKSLDLEKIYFCENCRKKIFK